MDEDTIRAQPGARRLGPGHFEGAWPKEKRQDIVDRVKYLVRGDKLEEPPHILEARLALKDAGRVWQDVDKETICNAITNQPGRFFQVGSWEMGSPEYKELVARIYKTQVDYYTSHEESGSGKFLDMLRDPATSSLCQQLSKAGIRIDKILHFTRGSVKDGHRELTNKIRPKRAYFFGDVAAYLEKAQRKGKIEHTTYELPLEITGNHECIEAILGINEHTFLVDTTLNRSFLQAIQEADLRPAVIMKEFKFWKDGADQDAKALQNADWLRYSTTHWLTQHYDVYSTCPGSGFATCDPTIYIRKGTSLAHDIKTVLRRATTLFSRSGDSSV
ncbi:uncharacterized protein B0H64DRAFT_476725 [Chaetomium fimeti]|uniref:Uncharacterized protein n=1 Tax=Chaetomium fimeti TaxID=1854472 RepID=A0AAE0LPK9_9PEZI|nr:hypothetical protein B0H64DRAFT_476725 [Chaetomium fimeti]